MSIAWPNIGTYQVNLTVTDNSGKSATTTATVVVDDSSIHRFPIMRPMRCPNLPLKKTLTLNIDASDAYDKSYQLTYHWDLNPLEDSDGNGDATDDPDYVGPSVDVEFSDPGGKCELRYLINQVILIPMHFQSASPLQQILVV